MCDPSDFCGKPLNVILLSLQVCLRDEERERTILDSHLLDPFIEPSSDVLPDEIGRWLVKLALGQATGTDYAYLQDEAARDVIVLQHVTLGENLLVPAREILLLRDINTDQSRALDLLLRRLLCFRLADPDVGSLLSFASGQLRGLGGLLGCVLGLALLVVGGVLSAVREGLGSGSALVSSVAGFLASHDEN